VEQNLHRRMHETSMTRSTVALLTLAISVAALNLTGCATRTGAPSPSTSPGNAEAQQAAEQFWYSALTKCGDSYYAKDNREITGFELLTYQFNEPSVVIWSRKLTEADRLNGLEWDGSATLRAKTSRSHVVNWGGWSNGSIFTGNMIVLKKINGRWLPFGRENSRHPLKKIDCQDVPK
jgi:hypothetical protein